MQTIVQIICSKGKSLRESISGDPKLSEFGFVVNARHRRGRQHGWAKIQSTNAERRGALNLEWDSDTNILMCRIVNRREGRPHLILGDFLTYVFERHHRRIKAVSIIPS